MDEVRELHLELPMVHGKQKVDIEFEEFEEKFENKGKGYAKQMTLKKVQVIPRLFKKMMNENCTSSKQA